MRIPPNLKLFLIFILIMGAIVLGTLYLPRYIPNIGKILTTALIGGVGLLVVFFFIKPFVGFLYARTDGILEVYTDQSGKGIHVFGTHLNGGGDSVGPSTRDIQHYFILLENGKIYYKCIYTHRMESLTGRSGWEGYTSFEESVISSPMFDKSMIKLSAKSGIQLQLADRIKANKDDHYIVNTGGKIIELKKFDSAVDEGFRVTCSAMGSGELVWNKKI